MFFTITYGVSDSGYLVSFFCGKLLELLMLDKELLMLQILLDYYLEIFVTYSLWGILWVVTISVESINIMYSCMVRVD